MPKSREILERIKNSIQSTAKIPILILDGDYNEYFTAEMKTPRAVELETQIKELMKENARLTEKKEQLTARKRTCIKDIMTLTGVAFDEDGTPGEKSRIAKTAKSGMSHMHHEVNEINAKLAEIDNLMKTIPVKIERANVALLYETASHSYGKIKKSQERLSVINPRVDALHKELKSLIDERVTLEEEVEASYKFLNKTLGGDIVNALDAEFLEKGKKKWF